jgi:peroxiredoxin Q/BCP
MSNLEIGQTAPQFSIEIKPGQSVSAKDYIGKFLVVYFYPKDNTPGCTVEARGFNSLYGQFIAEDAEVLGVSKDSLKSHERFCNLFGLTFPLGSDPEGVVCNLFGVMKEKSMFGKKYMGIDRQTFLIDKNGKIAYIWDTVGVMNHASEVLEKIKALKSK